MTHSNQRIGHRLLRGGVLAGLAVAAVFTTVDVTHVSAAATLGGSLSVLSGGSVITSGGTATGFALKPPVGAGCTSDTATGGYKVQSYMVPDSVDPSTLTFGSTGPLPTSTGNPTPGAFREPLYAAGSPFINKNTAVKTIDNPLGVLTGLPVFDFTVFSAGDIPVGTYNLGYACTVGSAGPNQLDKYWNVKLVFTANASDPLGVSWSVPAAPAAPTALAVTSTSTTSADLTWSAPSNAGSSAVTDYTVQYSATGGAPWTTFAHAGSATTGITVTGLASRTAYTFQVAAVNASAGAGAFSSAASGTTIAGAPGAPAIGTLGNGSVALSWAAPSGTAAVTYNLDITSTNGATWTSKATGLATAGTTVIGLVNGTSYKFRVSAVDAGGTSVVSATSAAAVPRTTAAAPGKPAVTPGKASVKLTWAAPASNGGAAITSYVVQKSTNGTTWSTVTSAAPLTRTYTVTGLVNGTKYFFRIAAKNAAGVGKASVANTSVPRTVPTAPGKPVATTAKNSVKLTWTAPKSNGGAAITGYVVQKSLDGVHWTTVTTSAPVTRVYTVTGLTTKKAYRFRVAAKNVAGVGAYSVVTAATPH